MISKFQRPLIADVAAKAKVSVATVDRVLNARGGVRSKTARLVAEAAAELGCLPDGLSVEAASANRMNIVFILPSGANVYIKALAKAIFSISSKKPYKTLNIRCYSVDSFDPRLFSTALLRYGKWADGVAFMSVDHPLVNEAAISLINMGKHVITIVSDISPESRTSYVGLDNRAAGRTCALLLHRMAGRDRGKVALIAASRDYRAHRHREIGFRSLVEEEFPEVEVVEVREGHDSPRENYEHTIGLLAAHPDLIGIYNLGGSSGGIAKALKDSGRTADVFLIGHGLTPDTRRSLIERTIDVIVTQLPELVVERTLGAFMALSEGRVVPQPEPLSMDIVMRENLPREARQQV